MPSDWEEKIDSIVAGRWCFIVAAFVLAIVAAQRAIQGAYLPWYDVRLAATFRIREFGELYSASDAGAILCTLYPPLAHLFYLPATIFSTPNAALITASALAIVVCLAAPAGARRGNPNRPGQPPRPAALGARTHQLHYKAWSSFALPGRACGF